MTHCGENALKMYFMYIFRFFLKHNKNEKLSDHEILHTTKPSSGRKLAWITNLLSCCDRLETGLCYCGCANVERTLYIYISPLFTIFLLTILRNKNFFYIFLLFFIVFVPGWVVESILVFFFLQSFAPLCVLQNVMQQTIFIIQERKRQKFPSHMVGFRICWNKNDSEKKNIVSSL